MYFLTYIYVYLNMYFQHFIKIKICIYLLKIPKKIKTHNKKITKILKPLDNISTQKYQKNIDTKTYI